MTSSRKPPLTYLDAGVDIAAGDRLVDRIRPLAASTQRPGSLGKIGGFGGLFELPPGRFRAPVLVSGTDGVGTKLKLAFEMNRHHTIGIESLVHAYDRELATLFEGYGPDATEENLQARIRGNLLMAISNKTGRLVLTTGNKSEMAVGYATLYGDMAGGFAVIKDVPKTFVYRLARYRNEISAVIPDRVITRAPSAELAPDQKDEDSLPPYDVLDPILEAYIEKDQSPTQIVSAGYDAVLVDRVIGLVNRNEYKRRQAPPGVKITQRAFGRDRRYPITSRFR